MSMDFPHKDKKRAQRRAQKERKQHNLSKKLDHQYSDPNSRSPNFDQWKEDYIRRHAGNPASCSCWMCQNPRRIFKDKLTIQEKRISQREKFCDTVD